MFVGYPFVILAVQPVLLTIEPHQQEAAQTIGASDWYTFRRVIFPSCLPQIITGIRIALGVAWLVVVAAEMIAVNSGLGYLIIDARNAGKRYDLVIGGMLLIGLLGLILDTLMRRAEAWAAERR